MTLQTAYLSFDIETDGPSPLVNNMLSFGISLIKDDGVILDELEVNIKERDGTQQDEETMKFWEQNKTAWNICHTNQISHCEAMIKLGEFYDKWSKYYNLIWIAMPVCFDWMFLKSYYSAYAPKNLPNIGFKATCISTLRNYFIKTKIIKSKEFDEIVASISIEQEHRCIYDARKQGLIFIKLIKHVEQKQKAK